MDMPDTQTDKKVLTELTKNKEDHTKMQNLNHNHSQQQPTPWLVKSSKSNEQEAAYYAALELVARIDEDLTRGVRHYRTKAGELLITLDEVIRAILDDNLLMSEDQSDVVWTPQELAA
jgi:hypothetical protein